MKSFEITRKTKETEIFCKISLNGSGKSDISTGIGFFDHMLQQMVFHSRMDMKLKVEGDLYVDDHHTVEDTGVVIGKIFKTLISDIGGINRYGFAITPMDESLCRAVVDISGRSFSNVNYQKNCYINGFSAENVKEFFNSIAREAEITIHIDIMKNGNSHHEIESIFKGFGVAFRNSITIMDGRESNSTKI